jgi:hypothetical protein
MLPVMLTGTAPAVWYRWCRWWFTLVVEVVEVGEGKQTQKQQQLEERGWSWTDWLGPEPNAAAGGMGLELD